MPIRHRYSLHGFKLDKGKFTLALDQASQVLVRQAAREYLRAVVIRVPVWSGAALGSVKFASGPNGNLGRFLNVSIPISPKKGAWRKNKNQFSGKGEYSFTSQRHIFSFLFKSDVIHFFLNNFFARTDPGAKGQRIQAPWSALEAGGAAFESTIALGIAKLPKVQDYILRPSLTIPE